MLFAGSARANAALLVALPAHLQPCFVFYTCVSAETLRARAAVDPAFKCDVAEMFLLFWALLSAMAARRRRARRAREI